MWKRKKDKPAQVKVRAWRDTTCGELVTKGPDGVGEDVKARVEEAMNKSIAGMATIFGSPIAGVGAAPTGRWPILFEGKHEDAPPLPKELVAGPIVAYRVWDISLGTGYLYPTTNRDFWPYLPAEAVCTISSFGSVCGVHGQGEQVPRIGCTCGWHAARAMDYLHENFSINSPSFPSVIGEVALWGKVIAHEQGYRAQYAHPLRIWLKDVPDIPGFQVGQAIQDELKLIGERYGCEVLEGPPR